MIIDQCVNVPIFWGRWSVSSVLLKLTVDVVSAVLRYFLTEPYWICHCVAYSSSPSGQALLQVRLRPCFLSVLWLRIRIQDPVPFWPGIQNRFFPDPGPQTYIFDSLMKNFWVKNKKLSLSSLGAVVGSGIRYSGSGMNKIRSRDSG